MTRSWKRPRLQGILLWTLFLLMGAGSRILLETPFQDTVLYEDPGYIQVSGDVRVPGVYAFRHRDPFLREAVARAGGLCGGAEDLEMIPEGIIITAGKKLTVTSNDRGFRFFVGEMDPYYKVSLGIPISINEAKASDLIAIPGIGPKLAEAIIKERERRGGFRSPEDLMGVSGIGRKGYERVSYYIGL